LKAVSRIMLTLLLTGMLTLAFEVQVVKAAGTVYIRADGSVDPSTAQILRVGSVYTLTGNITSDGNGIVVERDNIVVNGAGYTLEGTGAPYFNGIDLTRRSNITIKDMEIKAFSYGITLYSSDNNSIYGNNIANSDDWAIDLKYSSNNTISRNYITDNVDGIYLTRSANNSISGNNIMNSRELGIQLCVSSDDNRICKNNIASNNIGIVLIGLTSSCNDNIISANNITNNEDGIDLSGDRNTISGNNFMNNENGVFLRQSFNNSIWHNNFLNNYRQVYDEGDSKNFWDDGYPSGGNYWSDYNGTDADGDGIGDTPYVIDENNQDNNPLMEPWNPSWSARVPVWTQWWFWRIVIAAIAASAVAIYFWKKRKKPTPTVPPLPS